jgi:hypothetical protein
MTMKEMQRRLKCSMRDLDAVFGELDDRGMEIYLKPVDAALNQLNAVVWALCDRPDKVPGTFMVIEAPPAKRKKKAA